tara:strand:- start:275 stop:478 length:204 start_codon:yes stop_codon:yes gene_type:complete
MGDKTQHVQIITDGEVVESSFTSSKGETLAYVSRLGLAGDEVVLSHAIMAADGTPEVTHEVNRWGVD